MASSTSQFTVAPEGGPSNVRQGAVAVGWAGDSESMPIAFAGQNSLVYAAAFDAGTGPTGTQAPHAEVQGLSMPYQPCHCPQKTCCLSFAKHSTIKLKKPLPPSFAFAERVAARLHPPPPCQIFDGVNPTSADVVGEAEDRIQDLRTLAQWPRLQDLTLPSPLAGDVESDPYGVADRHGVKGLSVLTSFIDMDDFSCLVCAFKANTLQLAILHQQWRRHFQSA